MGSRRPSLAPSTLLAMISTLLLLAPALALAVPLPKDLTIEQFQQKAARSLEEVPGVRISKSYASVRSQGIGGQNNLVNFPTLLVRDPAELSPDRTDSKRDPSAKRPVFKPKDISEIEAEIKKINEAEVKAREEAAAEAIAAELEAEVSEASEADLDEITDIIAEEIVAEELENLDKITDLAAIDMAAEEVAEELLSADIDDLVDLKMDIIADADDSENEIIEGSGQLPTLDFGSITEVTY